MMFERDPLPDIERKIYKIIVNYSFYGKTPSISELCQWTGRGRNSVYEVLFALTHKKYIQWIPEKPEEITLNVRF